MYPSPTPRTFEEQAPFPGHPFGGLVREDRFGVVVTVEEPFPRIPADSGNQSEASDDATGGFDFHLGVYSRF
jgi:hypothetical protein